VEDEVIGPLSLPLSPPPPIITHAAFLVPSADVVWAWRENGHVWVKQFSSCIHPRHIFPRYPLSRRRGLCPAEHNSKEDGDVASW